MKQNVFFATSAFLLFFSVADGQNLTDQIAASLKTAEYQIKSQLSAFPDPVRYPRTVDKTGNIVATPINDWTEGFFPGCLWYLYELNGSPAIKDAAVKWTEGLEKLQYFTGNHDVGFLMYCSYGNAYRITKQHSYPAILVQSAKSLCTRYNKNVGAIESWNGRASWDGQYWNYPVIIDNMMNLELLYFASKHTGDPSFARIANRHAKTTAKNQFRKDYGSYHVVNYDTLTGKVLHRQTCQGFSDQSTWARGQAWGIYGYTMAYRETGNKKFLQLAENLASFWINHPNLPADGIPFWDFNAGQEGFRPDWKYDPGKFNPMPRDASAAAIACSAFLELSVLAPDGKKYLDAATQILASLTSPAYLAEKGTNGNFILKHSVGSIPHGAEVDVPLVYADYYFLESIFRYNKWIRKE